MGKAGFQPTQAHTDTEIANVQLLLLIDLDHLHGARGRVRNVQLHTQHRPSGVTRGRDGFTPHNTTNSGQSATAGAIPPRQLAASRSHAGIRNNRAAHTRQPPRRRNNTTAAACGWRDRGVVSGRVPLAAAAPLVRALKALHVQSRMQTRRAAHSTHSAGGGPSWPKRAVKRPGTNSRKTGGWPNRADVITLMFPCALCAWCV